MATITYGNGSDFFQTAFQAGAQATASLNNLILERNRTLMETARNVGGEVLNFFKAGYEKTSQIIARDKFKAMKANVQQANELWGVDKIIATRSLEAMQCAKPMMQNYLMANPVVRQMYYDGRLDGYSESYTDLYHGRMGENHIVYRQVMDGTIVCTDDTTKYVNYIESVDVNKLEVAEKFMIRASWEAMNRELDKMDEDPTSIYCASL